MNFLKKHKLLLLSLFFIVVLAGCRKITADNGTVLPEYILSLDTTFAQAWNDGLFTAIFVYPISLLVNYLATIPWITAGGAIIIVTLLYHALTTKFAIQQQITTQKQTLLQPEMARINAKYEGKNDQQSLMRKQQEIQALWNKHGVNPLASLLPMLIQFPFIFAMFGAIQRSHNLIHGEFLGIHLSTPISQGYNQSIVFIAIFALMTIANVASLKLPQYLTNKKKKEEGIKEKTYAMDKNQPDPNSTMNTMLIVMILVTSFFGWFWPIGMSLYWLVGSVARIIQALYIYKFHSLK